MLRAEATSTRSSAFAILSAEFASKIAGAKSHFKGAELAAALNIIRQHHLAAERALASRLSSAARARRHTVLAALRSKRKAQRKNFQAAAAHARPRHSAPESDVKERRQFRMRRPRRRRAPPRPRG